MAGDRVLEADVRSSPLSTISCQVYLSVRRKLYFYSKSPYNLYKSSSDKLPESWWWAASPWTSSPKCTTMRRALTRTSASRTRSPAIKRQKERKKKSTRTGLELSTSSLEVVRRTNTPLWLVSIGVALEQHIRFLQDVKRISSPLAKNKLISNLKTNGRRMRNKKNKHLPYTSLQKQHLFTRSATENTMSFDFSVIMRIFGNVCDELNFL